MPLAEGVSPELPSRRGRAPQELFHDYLEHMNAGNEQVEALFNELLEDVNAT